MAMPRTGQCSDASLEQLFEPVIDGCVQMFVCIGRLSNGDCDID